jgi:hypothetical protein
MNAYQSRIPVRPSKTLDAPARDAGLSEADIVETVGNVVANIFTNYLNNLANTDIDFPVRRARAA